MVEFPLLQPLLDIVNAARRLYQFDQYPEGNKFLLADVDTVAPAAQDLWDALVAYQDALTAKQEDKR